MIYKFLLYENNFITYRIFYFFSYFHKNLIFIH